MSILYDLYDRNICPAEKFAKRDGEYQRLMADMVDNIDKFMSTLDENGQRLWNEIRDAELQMESIADKESFIDGFCLGAQIMLEIISNDRTNRAVL